MHDLELSEHHKFCPKMHNVTQIEIICFPSFFYHQELVYQKNLWDQENHICGIPIIVLIITNALQMQ